MKRFVLRCAGLAALCAAAACVGDPTSDLDTGAVRVVASASELTIAVGDSLVVTAESRDAQGVRISTLPSVSSTAPGVASIVDAYLPPLPIARFYVKGDAAGDALILLTAGTGVDTITVTVN